jgi:hypothetical protein
VISELPQIGFGFRASSAAVRPRHDLPWSPAWLLHVRAR